MGQLALRSGLVEIEARYVRTVYGREFFAYRNGKKWGIADVKTGVAMLSNVPTLAIAWKSMELRTAFDIESGVAMAEKYIAEKGYSPRGFLVEREAVS